MSEEIELVSDSHGLAVIGSPSAVERFLAAAKLPSTELILSRLGTVSQAGSSVAQAGSTLAEQSGRWVKLTKESAEKVQQFGLTPTDKPRVSHAMIGERGSIQSWIQVTHGPGSPTALLTNPAALSGAAGIMAQYAMQQSMAEITDYLARIDEKLDDVLRAQTNQVLARMDGVDLAIKEAMTVRNTVGRVSDVTWSKIQHSSATILETQAYALRQLADLTDKIEDKARVDELAKIVKTAEVEVSKWLAAIARCFQLHDAIAVLELDRVLDAAADELDQHRLGLEAARQDRLELISDSTQLLLVRMGVAAETANAKVLMNPIQSPAVVRSTNSAATEVHELRQLLEIESGDTSSESRRWGDAAGEKWGRVRDASAGSIDSAKRLNSGTRDQARSAKEKVAGKARSTGAASVESAKSLGNSSRGKARSMKERLTNKRAQREHPRDDEFDVVDCDPANPCVGSADLPSCHSGLLRFGGEVDSESLHLWKLDRLRRWVRHRRWRSVERSQQ